MDFVPTVIVLFLVVIYVLMIAVKLLQEIKEEVYRTEKFVRSKVNDIHEYCDRKNVYDYIEHDHEYIEQSYDYIVQSYEETEQPPKLTQ